MRGQVVHRDSGNLSVRITPADAGTSRPHPARAQRLEDHPRGCGDKEITRRRRAEPEGSPPRMRGQDRDGKLQSHWRRITPADAGTSFCWSPTRISETDHPRGCGDKHQSDSMRVVISGSPPRMRGQGYSALQIGQAGGITPADAGTSLDMFCDNAVSWDHPRGCGDKISRSMM